jgi:hypothetical protein
MARSNKLTARRQAARLSRSGCGRRAAHSYRARQGKISLVTLIAILGLIVMLGFVGNAGHVVTTKVDQQNAADAIAFSTAQWMARGMNAVTATNHLLGEATALVVVIEGLGGPEADADMEAYPAQSKITDEVNRGMVGLATIDGLVPYGAKAAGKVDAKFLKAIITNLISKQDNKHKAFATIYDSKLVLKKKVTPRLIAKSIANAGLWVPPWWGWLTAIPAYAVHIGCNIELAEFALEYAILEGLEKLVTNKLVREVKVTIFENKLIPAIAAHGDYLAGRPSRIAKKRPTADSSIVNYAVGQSLDHLGKTYNVTAAIYPSATTFPGIDHLRLPIAPEAPPSMAGTKANQYEPEWDNDDLKFDDPKDPTAEIKRKMAENKRKLERRIQQLQQGITNLETLRKKVLELGQEPGVNQSERDEFKKEHDELADDIAAKKKELTERKNDLETLKAKEKEIDAALSQLKKAPGGSGNISAKPEHLALEKIRPSRPAGGAAGTNSQPLRQIGMSQAEERGTQWVRATYPYVDAFRAPILTMFRENLDECEAAKHYKKWTDRYTLTKAWQFRSGYRFRRAGKDKEGNDAGEWYRDTKLDPLSAYVMVERFEPNKKPAPLQPGARRVPKGYEEWTKDTKAGKEMAEDMLTVVAMTHRELKPLFSPVIYPVASKNGITTFAQAIFYNSNEQAPNPQTGKSTTQAKVGWDTLNWEHTKPVPEWGTELTRSKAKYPWQLFGSSTDWKGNAGVKLNWQAKLMPVTRRRLMPAGLAAGKKSIDMGKNVALALPWFDPLVTH